MTTTTIRRIDGAAKVLAVAAMVCAGFAAIGIATGLHEASPGNDWTVPIIAGVVGAIAFAAAWHVLITSIKSMVKPLAIVAVFAAAVAITAFALSASAQAIVTAIAGHSALSAELSRQVESHGHALAEAYGEAMKIDAVASSASAKAAGYRKQAATETAGSNGTGQGCGPRCASLMDISGSFDAGYDALARMMREAADLRDAGNKAMANLRTAASTGDQDSFMAAAQDVAGAIAGLNGIDPRPVIASTGSVVVSKKGIDLSKDTAEFEATAERVLADRTVIDAPVFAPMSPGEAVRRQMFGAALHGWAMAAAIDVLPLLFLIIVFVLSREPWQQEIANPVVVTPEERSVADRRRLDALTGSGVVPFRQPAE